MIPQTNALEDLRIIRRMIEETRQSTGRHWLAFLVWGSLGVLASAISHVLVMSDRSHHLPLAWGTFLVMGMMLNRVLATGAHAEPRVRTFADRALGAAWTAVLVTMLSMVLASLGLGVMAPMFIPGVIALLIGSGVFVTGALLEWRPFYAAASVWWLGGIAMLARPREAFLLEIVLLLFGYLIPAYVLRRHYRNLTTSDGAAA